MPAGKRQIIAKKIRSLFKPGEWQHAQHKGDESLPPTRSEKAEKAETTLSVLNSGVPLTVDVTPREDNEQSTPGVSPTEVNPDEIGPLDNSPLLRSPLSPISLFGEVNNNILKGDMERTQKRYQAAVLYLKQALERRPESWDGLDVNSFGDIMENNDTLKLRQAVENRLNQSSNSPNTIWSKGRKLFEQVFVVFFPLTRNILVVAKEGQAVFSQSLFY
jgi:hypothetical protein